MHIVIVFMPLFPTASLDMTELATTPCFINRISLKGQQGANAWTCMEGYGKINLFLKHFFSKCFPKEFVVLNSIFKVLFST